uniref:7TM_GPCR_Srx domain-containing protein n=1 Tax=Onchocerca volvulus TaxID=6282 RepID=A0A8R1XRA5_ONCVO
MTETSALEDRIAIACVTLVSVFGLVSNRMSLYVALTKTCYCNAFGILCSGFLICNLQAEFVHFTWCTIVLSVFHAFVHATKYNQLWSQSNIFKVVVIVWSSAMVYCTHHLFNDCTLLFNRSSTYNWLHYGQICGNFDAAASVVIVLAIACIDFITFIKILAYRRAKRKNTAVSIGSDIEEREILFFKQSCKLDILYISLVVIFNVPVRFFTDEWILFLSGTISWILMHSLDG